MGRLSHLGVALLGARLVACASPLVAEVELGDLDVDYAFLAVMDETGRVTRLTQPVGIADGELAFGALPTLRLEPREESFLLVGLRRAVLEAYAPGFLVDGQDELQVETAFAPDPPDLLPRAEGGWLSRGRLPPNHVAYRGKVERGRVKLEPATIDSRLLEELTFTIPVDPEHCRMPNVTPLEPFGSVESPMAEFFGGEHTVHRVAFIDRDRVLVAASQHLFLLRRGQPLVPVHAPAVGANVISLRAMDPQIVPGAQINDLVVAPAEMAENGWRDIWFAGGHPLARNRGGLWHARVNDSGLEWVETATASEDMMYSAVALRTDGALLLGTNTIYQVDGKPMLDVLIRERGQSSFTVLGSLPLFRGLGEDFVFPVLPTSKAHAPLAVATESRVHQYRTQPVPEWIYEEILQTGFAIGEPVDFLDLSEAPRADGKLELWAAASRGILAHGVEDDPWTHITPRFPPRFKPCASSPVPGKPLEFHQDYRFVRWLDGYLHVVAAYCSAIIQIRVSDLCVSLVPPAGEEPAFIDDGYRFADLFDGRLVVGSHDGRVLMTQWR